MLVHVRSIVAVPNSLFVESIDATIAGPKFLSRVMKR